MTVRLLSKKGQNEYKEWYKENFIRAEKRGEHVPHIGSEEYNRITMNKYEEVLNKENNSYTIAKAEAPQRLYENALWASTQFLGTKRETEYREWKRRQFGEDRTQQQRKQEPIKPSDNPEDKKNYVPGFWEMPTKR